MKYFLPISALCLAGCITTKAPVTPIKIGITHLQTVNESVYNALDEQKSSIAKIQIYTTGDEVTLKDMKAAVDALRARYPKQ